MKYTSSQLTRLATSGGLRTIPRRPMAYRRVPESRWVNLAALFIAFLAVMIVLGLWGIQ
jgi:hypothetical protein